MSDFLAQVLADKAPIARDVKVLGKTGTVYFKRITAGQRHQLLGSAKYSMRDDVSHVEFDSIATDTAKQKWVLYSVCKEDGTAYFKDEAAVQAAGALVVEALYEAARAVNSDEEDAKKD